MTNAPVRAWLDGYLGEQRLGRDRPIARWHVPLDIVPSNADRRTLVLDNQGQASAAYRLVRRWNDPREDLLSEGTSLSRALSPEGSGPLERDVRAEILLKAGQRLRATHALHVAACAHDLVLRSPMPGGLAALSDGLHFQIRDCLGRPARVYVRRAPEATEFHIDEVGAGEQAIEELWLARHRGDFEVPPTSLRIGGERRAVGGSLRIRVE